jgi:hypothetical protein
MPIADSAIKELISKGILKVEPYDPKYVDSCSITLHLAPVIVTDKQPDNLDLHLFFSDENYVKNRLEKLARMDISREKPFHLARADMLQLHSRTRDRPRFFARHCLAQVGADPIRVDGFFPIRSYTTIFW